MKTRCSTECSNRSRGGRAVPKSGGLGCLRAREWKGLLLALLNRVQRFVNGGLGVSYRARESGRTGDWS